MAIVNSIACFLNLRFGAIMEDAMEIWVNFILNRKLSY